MLRPDGLLVVSDMHPWMRHRGTQANFDDESGVEVRLDGHLHPISEYVMASRRAGFELEIEEHAADAALAERFPRAEKYAGWPMLVVLRARRTVPAHLGERPLQAAGDYENSSMVCRRFFGVSDSTPWMLP